MIFFVQISKRTTQKKKNLVKIDAVFDANETVQRCSVLKSCSHLILANYKTHFSALYDNDQHQRLYILHCIDFIRDKYYLPAYYNHKSNMTSALCILKSYVKLWSVSQSKLNHYLLRISSSQIAEVWRLKMQR